MKFRCMMMLALSVLLLGYARGAPVYADSRNEPAMEQAEVAEERVTGSFVFHLEHCTVTAVGKTVLPSDWTEVSDGAVTAYTTEHFTGTGVGVSFTVTPEEGFLITSAYYENHANPGLRGGVVAQNGSVVFAYTMHANQDVDHYATAYRPQLSVSIRQEGPDEVEVGRDVTLDLTVTPDDSEQLRGFEKSLQAVTVIIGDTRYTVPAYYQNGVWTGSFTYTVREEDARDGAVTATVFASVNYSGTVEVTNNGETAENGTFTTSATVNSTDTVVFSVRSPALAVTKTVDKPAPQLGDTVTYTVTVTNSGQVDLHGITVEDRMEGIGLPGDQDWEIDSLPAGESRQWASSFTVTEEIIRAFGGQTLTGTAAATGYSLSGIQVSASDAAVVTIPSPAPALTVAKTADQTGGAGLFDRITYTVTVSNTGNVTVTGITVTDPLTGMRETIPSLLPGESGAFTTAYVVTAADVSAGAIENAAFAEGVFDGEKITASGAVVMATEKIPLTVVITGNRDDAQYDGKPHEIGGFTAETEDRQVLPPGLEVVLAPEKRAYASGTDAGIYPMGLTAADFSVTGENAGCYDVKIRYTDGCLEIRAAGESAYTASVLQGDLIYGEQPEPAVEMEGPGAEGYSQPEITYYRVRETGEEPLSERPKDAGTYKVEAVWPATKNLPEIRASAVFVIGQRELFLDREETRLYTGGPVTLEITPQDLQEGGLVYGDSMTLSARITGTDPGIYTEVEGLESLRILNGDEDVSGNYTVRVTGKLTIAAPQAPPDPPEPTGGPDASTVPDIPHIPDAPHVPDVTVPGTEEGPPLTGLPFTVEKCCVLHLLILLPALAAAVYDAYEEKRCQKREWILRRALLAYQSEREEDS